MSYSGALNPASEDYESRPHYYIGQHDSDRCEVLDEDQYNQVLNSGFNFVTAPITNQHFVQRVVALHKDFLKQRQEWSERLTPAQRTNPSLPVPIVSTLTDEDTSLYPSHHIGSLITYASPWIDLCSPDPYISGISRQVLNLEVAYANFCGARTIVVPGPRQDESGRGVAQYARAIQEALLQVTRANLIIHLPMYREPLLEEKCETLSEIFDESRMDTDPKKEIDIFTSWDSWHTIRSVCEYSNRLFVALRIPRRVPEKTLQERWFSEPLHFLTIGQAVFQSNKAGNPTLSKHHQDLINRYMRLKNAPWIILNDVGPNAEDLGVALAIKAIEYPSLAEASKALQERKPKSGLNDYVSYMKYLERQQTPYTAMETPGLTSFQDWLQSPLQPLADNLESATYEVFEGDPVKYDQYQQAITEAMAEWKILKKPSALGTEAEPYNPELICAVAGAGRGPLVTRVLRAAAATNTKIQLWALEKNQNAFVYLLNKNKKREWNNQVTLVKTDMRGWAGPIPRGSTVPCKVDILVTELLGSFGDNELSPECLDGIQHHLFRPTGISIPHSYTAHLSPISTPRIFAELSSRESDPHAFEIPYVVRLFQLDFVAQKVPNHGRFQQAWEFVHPVGINRADEFAEEYGLGKKFVIPGGGAMYGSNGTNEHNARHCHLTFVCPTRGVVHGLAGYFESVLYESQVEGGQEEGEKKVEISILPDQIDKKSKDMISWFPIFFPLKKPLYFPQDTELEVSMWRQTDDTKVWYEWLVEVYAWVGPQSRIKVGASEMHSSKKVACLM